MNMDISTLGIIKNDNLRFIYWSRNIWNSSNKSIRKKNGRCNLKNISQFFDIYHQKMEHFKKTFPNFIYELELEKLVEDPENESKKLMKFCGLPWDKKCLEYYKRKDLISRTTSNLQIRKAIYKHSEKRHLPYKPFLDKYGYKYSWYN